MIYLLLLLLFILVSSIKITLFGILTNYINIDCLLMDVAFFVVGASIGLGVGLVCRRNNVKLLPNYRYVDMGVLGKNHYFDSQ
jgi:hypothetical protein